MPKGNRGIVPYEILRCGHCQPEEKTLEGQTVHMYTPVPLRSSPNGRDYFFYLKTKGLLVNHGNLLLSGKSKTE